MASSPINLGYYQRYNERPIYGQETSTSTSVGTSKPTLRISYDEPESISTAEAEKLILEIMETTYENYSKIDLFAIYWLFMGSGFLLSVVFMFATMSLGLIYLPVSAFWLGVCISFGLKIRNDALYCVDYKKFYWKKKSIISEANEHFIKFNKIYQKYYVRKKNEVAD